MQLRWLILLGLWLCYFSFGAIAASIAPLVPLIQADIGLSHSALGSIMGAWQLVYIAAAIPAGMLLDRLGARLAITLGVCLIAVSALGRAFAEDYWQLLGAVMLFGLGGPIISSGAPKVVTDIFTGSQRGLAMGIYMTGPTLGGILALTLTHTVLLPGFNQDWRQIMLLWGGIALIAAVIWLAIASTSHTWTERDEHPPERRSGSAVLPGLLATPGVVLLLCMAAGAFLINHGLNNWLPELLRNGGMTLSEASNWAALPMLIGIIGSLTIPRLATPPRRLRILLALCISSSVASVLLTIDEPGILTSALLIQGLVRSSLMTVLILTLMELPGMKQQHAGTASGLFFSAAEVGGVLGPLGLGVLYDLTQGFNIGLYFLSAVAALMALSSLRLRNLMRINSGAV
jgi:CP family cyanate transporter-like MFS transporter